MAIFWRNTPPGLAFLWEQDNAMPARWHRRGEGPAQYLADTPSGAWAEFLRHEEIIDPDDVVGLSRDLWAIEVDDGVVAEATPMEADDRVLRGGTESYANCQLLAAAARAEGATAVSAPSAALVEGEAAGWRVDQGLIRAPAANGRVVVLYGRRPDLVAHKAVAAGHPPRELVAVTRPLHGSGGRRRRRARPATAVG
jgi:hypothetical protein